MTGHRSYRTKFVAGWAALALCIAALLVLRSRAMRHYLATQHYQDVYYVPPSQWLSAMSLGYTAALADLLWTRALVYFGTEIAHKGEVKHVFDYGDAIATLDPHFRRVYSWVATAALYRTGTITEADGRRAIAFLRRGRAQFPDDGDLAWRLGAVLTYELPSFIKDAGEREAARNEGVYELAAAARLGGGPPWLALNNASRLVALGQAQAAISHLEEVYASVQDPELKTELEERLAMLRNKAAVEALREASRQFERQRLEAYPFADAALFVQLGARVLDRPSALEARRDAVHGRLGEEL